MPSLLRCSQPDCRAVPVASCFAQPQGWSFTTRHSRLLRQHVDSHRKFAAHKDQLLLLADKVRRSEEGPAAFTCQCGFSATLGKIVKHKCGGAASNTVAGAVAKRATRKRKASAAKRCNFSISVGGASKLRWPRSCAQVLPGGATNIGCSFPTLPHPSLASRASSHVTTEDKQIAGGRFHSPTFL